MKKRPRVSAGMMDKIKMTRAISIAFFNAVWSGIATNSSVGRQQQGTVLLSIDGPVDVPSTSLDKVISCWAGRWRVKGKISIIRQVFHNQQISVKHSDFKFFTVWAVYQLCTSFYRLSPSLLRYFDLRKYQN